MKPYTVMLPLAAASAIGAGADEECVFDQEAQKRVYSKARGRE